MYEYDTDFLRYTHSTAKRSAQVIVPIIEGAMNPKSVLDVGCGPAAWLEVWKEHGAAEVLGVDGEYVDRATLAIDDSEFVASDLGGSIDLGRRFDLVQSLEVAEHLPASRARGFISDLCRHSDIVMFSAAPPGQGGENHINEQPYAYWRGLFSEYGYVVVDFVRPLVASRREVAPWYRYNTLLYVKRAVLDSLPESVRSAAVTSDAAISDVSPPLYKIRKSIVRHLPPWVTQALADMTKKLPRAG